MIRYMVDARPSLYIGRKQSEYFIAKSSTRLDLYNRRSGFSVRFFSSSGEYLIAKSSTRLDLYNRRSGLQGP